ncbi:rRNA maturation RNase YbeY [Rhodophyticola sp. SM2404]
MEVDLLIEAAGWEGVDIEALAEIACPAALEEFGLDPSGFCISILACNDARISELNTEFRAKPVPTNVLSWPSEEIDLPLGQRPALPEPDTAGPPHELGDIAIAYETCAREAAEQSKPVAQHVTHLLVHSTLHLLGFDHINDEDAQLMEGLETRILAKLGVPDPY